MPSNPAPAFDCFCDVCKCGHPEHIHLSGRDGTGSTCMGCRCEEFRSERPSRVSKPLVALVALVLLAIGMLAFSGCAIGYGYRDVPARPCLTPEAAFAVYVSHERNDPTATSAGSCETGQTEDTGDEFTICPVRTARHGVIHKRLLTRACWR